MESSQKNILWILCWCSIVYANVLFASDSVNYRQIPPKEELTNQSVFNVLKDKDGFIWLASRTKIIRYDGRNVRHYSLVSTGNISNENSLQIGIYLDGNDCLWAYNNKGNIYCYDSSSDSFIFYLSIRQFSDDAYWLSDLQWHNNRLWMATSKGLFSHSTIDGKEETKKYFDSLFINKIAFINDSVLAIGTTTGLFFIDSDREVVLIETACETLHVTSLYYDDQQNLIWIGTFNSGLLIWDVRKKAYQHADFIRKIPLMPIRTIKQMNNDNLLIGSDGSGVYKIDLKKGQTGLFLSDKYNNNGQLTGNGVYDILIDGKNIWVGVYSGGVTILKGYDDFDRIYHIPHNRESLIDGHVNAILEDRDGDMWYACNSGVSMYEIKTQRWKHYFEKQNSFLTLIEDSHGRIWCGGYNVGVYCIDKKKGVVNHIKSFQKKKETDCIYASAMDKDGNLWFGGLYNPLTCITDGEERIDFYNITQVRAIVPVNNDTLFIATAIGFYLLNRETGKFNHYFSEPLNYGITDNLYNNTYIYSGVLIDNDLWFGTEGGGLNCLNLKSGKAINYSEESHDLPSNYIYGILKDGNNTLWISTNNGLFNFDPQTQKVLSSIADLPEKEFVPMAYTQLKDGRMAFGSRNGGIIFHPDKIRNTQQQANFHFTDFRISYRSVTNKDILPAPIDEVSHITLKHNQNTFAFDFISIDLYRTDSYLYDYKLEGFDSEWTPKSDVLTASYTNISPGKYRFRVRCISSTDKKVLDERMVAITILQPFWNTIWAWLIYFVLFAGIVYWIWTYFKERMLQRQSEEKINFFINVAHDIRTPLSLIMSPLKDIEKEPVLSGDARSYLALAQKNGTKLLSLVTQLLDFQREDINPSSLNPTLCNFNVYLTERVELFKTWANTKNINIRTDIPDENMILEVDVKKMDRILDNLLSNAIKYTPDNGSIYIRLLRKKNELELIIEDTGIGISKKEQGRIFNHFFRAENAVNSKEVGSGIGLVLTKKLVKQMNGKLSFVSFKDKGTTFYLSIPVKESQPAADAETQPPEITENDKTENFSLRKHKPLKTFYRVLLVEDNDDMRNYLENKLSHEYKVYAVPSAEDALAFLGKNTVDIVVSDVMMDGMKGDELCKILKNNIETSHILVILLTALSEKDQILVGLGSGADDYITKPFDIEVLTAKIRNFLLSRTKLQEYYLTGIKLQDIKESISDEEKAPIAKLDDDFLKKCVVIITENIANSDFTVNDLYRELAMSKTLVFDKLKALTNQGPNEFIRIIRLKYAKELLQSHKYSIQEVADMTGFSDAKYFSTVFKKYYGINPSNVK